MEYSTDSDIVDFLYGLLATKAPAVNPLVLCDPTILRWVNFGTVGASLESTWEILICI